MLRFAFAFHAPLVCEGQIGSVPGAALALTVAALAVVHRDRFAGDFITDRAAGASAGISLAHVLSPSINCCWTTKDPERPFGATTTTTSLSPCCTRRGGGTTGRTRRVPSAHRRATGTCLRGRPLRARVSAAFSRSPVPQRRRRGFGQPSSNLRSYS